MADFRHGNQGQQAVDHTQARTENGNEGDFLSVNLFADHRADRGFDVHVVHGKIARNLKAHQQGNLGQQGTEVLGAGVLVTHQGEFVLNQRMIENVKFPGRDHREKRVVQGI